MYRENIITDYMQTEVFFEDVFLKRLEALPEDMRAKIPPDKLEMAFSSKAPTMKQLLAWMDEQNFAALMAERGFGREETEKLKAVLLEDPREEK